MKIIITFLVCAVLVIADLMGIRTEANPSQLRSKIINGEHETEEGRHVASLQLNKIHICTSGLFREDYLLTTGECAWHIKNGMENKLQKGTAVVGSKNLEEGLRINILRVRYHSRFLIYNSSRLNNFYDVGVIRLEEKIDPDVAKPLELYWDKTDLRVKGYDPSLCGWGTTTNDDEGDQNVVSANYSKDLHCISVTIYSRSICTPAIPPGDYKNNLMCGKGAHSDQAITLGDMGSPLTKAFEDDKGYTYFIIGITLHPFESQEDGLLLRFIRTSSAYIEIEKLVMKLQKPETVSCAKITSPGSVDKSNKRRKFNLHD